MDEKRPEEELHTGEIETQEVKIEKQDKRVRRKMNKGMKICMWMMIGVVAFVGLLGLVGGRSSYMPYSSGPLMGDNIGLIRIEGTITSSDSGTGYNHQWTLDTIDSLIGDSDNEALVLFINTPGGGVYESDEVYLKIEEYKERTGRPVYAALGTMAASGGYYIAASADKIYANRNTLTGSIGVTMGTVFDISEFLQRYGVKTKSIVSGANKAMGSMTDPLTTEQVAIYQSIVNDSYEQFVGIVSKGRKMDINMVKSLADGRIYTATQAKNNGLVDGIATLEETIDLLRDKYPLEDAEVVEYYYQDDSFWAKMMEVSADIRRSAQSDVGQILEMVEDGSLQPMYMYEGM